ncbi:sigma-E factor negative regulatory protein [Actimicrobium sp. CCC2.4]|uniref:sigma-E factor negative regulatory protein n=1 Tax=Actimicrobium sp. CCC2.4 TaxID=3048606 RepID=UPI002AC99518|nr:sigma-E factor negative regulatory protein [Actimicrobium sp. CCC2.4]MEB0135570.1 sigma-E factor negative regulatory protein [Actimicrobium sp. CCC2.4]WPX33866.1 sigma-E factor negative regulatory protein [Actimicrobium sp. CCC2.4]
MKANDMMREEISAFADGELAKHRWDDVAKKLRQPAEQDCWALYHQIGDVLRSDDMATMLSADFSARLAARLDLEPAIIARPPDATTSISQVMVSPTGKPALKAKAGRWMGGRKFIVPGLAAAAAVAYMGLPQLMMFDSGLSVERALQAAQGDRAQKLTGLMVAQNRGAVPPERVEVLRDSRMDEYLLAHQQFSPSLYSSAQFARSATFATNTGK